VNWINNVVRPKIRSFLTTKRDVPEKLWVTCPQSGQMVFYKDLEANQFVVPGSEYHMKMDAPSRLRALFDEGVSEPVPVPDVPVDPLKFKDERRYTDRLRDAKEATEFDDAVLVAEGLVDGQPLVAAVQDFRFMAGSLGMAAGEAVIAGMLRAVERSAPFVLFTASGGARMQEGILSLMQMPRTTIAVQRLRDAGLPFIVILTDPTTGGVTASYAMLGDVHIAEPGALICFAGPRVIQQTIREQLPEGFQRAEYLLEHGMIDMVVHRHQLPETISRLCRLLMSKPAQKGARRTGQAVVNGRGHLNGGGNATAKSDIDVRELGSESGEVIEPQPVSEAERFPAVTSGLSGGGSGGAKDSKTPGQKSTDQNS
jgi:acetyl-CoA carboxylase carboxyl transferase subunit beta